MTLTSSFSNHLVRWKEFSLESLTYLNFGKIVKLNLNFGQNQIILIFRILILPGDEDFLATGGGVFLLLGTGDFSLSDVSLFEEEL